MRRRRRLYPRRLPTAAPALSLVLLAGLLTDHALFHEDPGEAAGYHAAVRAAAESIPWRIGAFVGTDVPVPPAAVSLLRPNVLLCRSYRNVDTDRSATLLLVQVRDARDLIGHYPPACYPAHGWEPASARPRDWTVKGTVVPGMRYRFVRERLDGDDRIVVDNFLILPDGEIVRGMDDVDRVARDSRKKYYGAAQIQLLYTDDFPPDELDRIFRTLVGANLDVVRLIEKGVQDERP